MHILYDNLVAVLVSGLLLMILVQISRSGNEARVDTTRYYASRVQANAFIQTMQRDFQNLGAGVDASQPMILDYQWSTSQRYIEFVATLDTTAGAPVEQIKYEMVPTRTVQSRAGGIVENVQCFEVRRYLLRSGSYVLNGKSMDTITAFEIDLRQANGASISSDLNETRQVVVRTAALSPLGEEGIIKRTRWQTRFQPANLQRKDT